MEIDMRKIVAILCTLDVILMALSVVLYLDEDRTAPVIHMEEVEMEYREGMSDEEVVEEKPETGREAEDGENSGKNLTETERN